MTTRKLEYAIRGGLAGRERLRVLARTLDPSTSALFDRLAVRTGLICLDAGCGGGDVTFELARRVGQRGQVVGVDMDKTKIDLARQEAAAQGITNVEFHVLDIRNGEIDAEFDLVYVRFLLTHLADPARRHRRLLPLPAAGRAADRRGYRLQGQLRLARDQSLSALLRALLRGGLQTRGRPGYRAAAADHAGRRRLRAGRHACGAADGDAGRGEADQPDHAGKHRRRHSAGRPGIAARD